MQLTQMAQINPDVLDIPNWDKMVKGNADMLGVPAKYMQTDAAIKAQRDQREAQQQQMMEAQQAQMEGEAMKAVGEGEQAMEGEA
jgi:hypothetical protein